MATRSLCAIGKGILMFGSIANLALRAIPGAYILNSGLNKLGMDKDTATFLRDEASKGVPMVKDMEPNEFRKFLTYGEISVGAALLLPFVPKRIAGLALGVFSAGLVSTYLNDPSKTQDDGIRPSEEGTSLAKDSWLMAIAIALVFGKK